MTARAEPRSGQVPLPGKWALRGACRGWPTEWWYPGGQREAGRSAKQQKADLAVALRICRDLCPVRVQCLAHAVRYREAGIWGGTTETDRRQFRTRRWVA